MLTYRQKYSILTMLSTNTLTAVLMRIPSGEATKFAVAMDKHFGDERSGFMPHVAIDILNGKAA